MDFTQINVANSAAVKEYWMIGTITTCGVMGLGMIYIVVEVRSQNGIKRRYHFWLTMRCSGSSKRILVPKATETQ